VTPARWHALEQALALTCVTAGVALLSVPAALIVCGIGLYASTVLDRRT
jgi:hypothetical protein